VAYRYQQCYCLAPLPAKMSVFKSHMQGSHSVISNKLILHTKINPYSYNESRAVASGVQWCPDHHLKSGPPFHVWSPGCCIYQILYQKMLPPLWFLVPPAAKSCRQVWIKTKKLCYQQKNMSVLIWFETIIEYWFHYSSSLKFSSATQT